MDNRKREIIITVVKILVAVLALVSLLLSTGCSGNDENKSKVEDMVPKAGTVQLYHATDTSVEPDEGTFQLMQPDNIAASVEEVLEKLQISDKIYIEKYMIDIIDNKKTVVLYIKEKGELTEEEILLNKAAIVKSIQSIGVDEISINLTDTNGKNVEKATYTDASFFSYGE